MALGVGSKAPHGGIFVFFAIDPAWAYVLAVVVGSVVAGLLVTALKSATARKSNLATEKVAQEVAA